MTQQPFISDLLDIPKFGNGTGLHRMAELCRDELRSDWAKRVRVVNVVGSNGKGSTSNIIKAILAKLFPREKTGLYTSPHLINFHERIVVNDELISDAALVMAVNHFKQKQAEYLAQHLEDAIGAFEAFTAIAIGYFAKEGVDNLVLEAGIGGRYDSTKILGGDIVALTSLDLEHTVLLGNTLEEIGYDKMDMAKPGGIVVAGEIKDAAVLSKLKTYAQAKGITLCSIQEESTVNRCEITAGKMTLDIEIGGIVFRDIVSALVGTFQVSNILVGVMSVMKLCERHGLKVGDDELVAAVKAALGELRVTGRFQQVLKDPECFIDVAHTPDAIAHLTETIKKVTDKPILLVTGVSYDKNAEEIVRQLSAISAYVICTRAYHKGSDVDVIYNYVPGGISKVKVPTIEAAMDMAIDKARKEGYAILVAGGLFLAIEAYSYLDGVPPQSLQFF